MKRVLLALFVVFGVGAAGGVGLSFAMPTAAVFDDDRARLDIGRDTGGALEQAAALADDGDPALFARSALANALLLVDHAGGAAEKKRADALLKTTLAFVRTAPEALYARALLRRFGVDDGSLDEDLEKRADDAQKNAWWLLAKATRAWDQGKRDDAFSFAQRAALGDDPPVQAQVELARQSIARGDVADARALAERAERTRPDHAQARVAGIVAAVIDDVRDESPEERAVKLKKLKQRQGPRKDGPPKPGEHHDVDADAEASLALWHTPQEDGAIERLDHVDERDAPVLAFVIEALAATRGDEALAADMKKRVLAEAPRHATLAARQAELMILDGDTAGADELLQAALEKNPGNAELLLDQARLHALAVVGEDELHRRAAAAGAARAVTPDGLALPFGKMKFDPFGIGGIPFRIEPDAALMPEASFAAALRSSNVQKKLDVAVLVHKAGNALARGDIPAASEAAAQARTAAAGDPEVLLLDARIRLRQADRNAAREAIDAAVNAAPDDPHVLLVAARLHYDNEGYIPARKVLGKLRALGFKSPAALALEAMLEARTGDAKAAQAALAEAESISAGDVEILRANVLLLRDGKDLEAVRKAADKLFAVDELRATDPILRSWEADAAARQGDTLRAQAVLEEVIAGRPALADPYLLLGSIEAGTDVRAAAASFDKCIELAPGSPVAAEASRRRATLPAAAGAAKGAQDAGAAKGAPPADDGRAKPKGKLLPRKKSR